MDNATALLLQFIRHPGRVGALAPSSRRLARTIVAWPDLDNARAVAEVGTGTGVFTEAILESLGPDCRFFGIEIDARLVNVARKRHPNVTIHHDSVANIKEICRTEDVPGLDCVICGLPWAAFSAPVQKEFMDAITAVLRPGGQFGTFAYRQSLLTRSGRRFQSQLHRYFGSVSRSRTVWRNFPPAFVYQCMR